MKRLHSGLRLQVALRCAALASAAVAFGGACSSDPDDPGCVDNCASGGFSSTGGASPSGGNLGSGAVAGGGSPGTGGAFPSGGAPGAGGGPAGSGGIATGGVGSGGILASGGVAASGGTSGGGASSGGIPANGGAGGVQSSGGSSGSAAFVMGAENKNGSHELFEDAVQCDVNINQITTGWCNSWSSWEQTGCNVFAEVSAFHKADSKHAVELSLTPWPQAMTGQSWGACARGDYDGHYTNIAKSILANGMTHVIFRLGYEWDGNWFPWGTGLHETGNVDNQGKGGTAMQYAACFKRFDAAIQAVARTGQGVFWRTNMNPIHDTPATKESQLQQVLDAAGGPRKKGGTVDFLGVDFYDYPARNNFDSRMAAALAFAKKNAIPLSFPEWGLGGDSRAQPGVDDAGVVYLKEMADVFANPANGVLYASYFNCASSDCAGNHSLIPPNSPKSQQKFIELFGNGRLGCGANARAMIEKM